MNILRSGRFILSVLFTLSCATFVLGQEAPLQGFDEYVNKAMKEWEAPGVAIAIVKDDKIVFAKGYGVRELGKPAPVDERTMFAIGSSSKAFTAAAIAMLVDEGKAKWDDPVTKHLAGFELYDAYVSQQMTLRDLLCHRSGLERGDLLWYGSSLDRNEIIRRVRFLKPTWSFRSHFGYQNIMYLTAGQVLPAVTGQSWDEFIKARIFTPLGMKQSNTSIRDLKGMEDVAAPHAKIDGKVVPVPWRDIDNIAPAGSINSNVVEMAQWVRLQLGEGVYQGNRLISSGAIKEMQKPHTIINNDPPWNLLAQGAHFIAYGLGWMLHDYHDRKIVEHGGNIDGMSALVSMVPEEKLGIVILTNMNGSALREALEYRIIDAFIGRPQKDWSATVLAAMKAFEAQGEAAKKKTIEGRVKETKPSLALEKYAGTYQSEMYGDFKVEFDGGKLVARHDRAFVGDLEHWHYDTFQATWRDRMLGKGMITFTLNSRGEVAEAKIDGMGEFTRAPDKAGPAAGITLSAADLNKFQGKYAAEALPIEISIETVGGKLKAVVPGQPVYTLIPVAPTRFQIEGAPAGFFVNFEMTGDAVKSLKLEQGPAPAITLFPKRAT